MGLVLENPLSFESEDHLVTVYDVVFLVVCGKPINHNLGWFIIGIIAFDQQVLDTNWAYTSWF